MTKKQMSNSENETLETGKRCLEFLDTKKAENTILMDLRKVNSYLSYFLIASGNSQIHCRALARDLERYAVEQGLILYGKPDYNSEWIIIDFGEIIAHIFTEEMRDYYQLEKLWGDADKFYIRNRG